MHKVAFLVERTDERIDCLLNPESLVQRRSAGLRPRADATGAVTGHELGDDPLLATGGGVTEFDLDLLFDVALMRDLLPPPPIGEAPAEPPPDLDVRTRTRPLWALAERAPHAAGYGVPPRVRLIWGQAWNLRGVVVSVAERLERFTPAGVPQRSWMRLRLRRVPEETSGDRGSAPVAGQEAPPLLDTSRVEVPTDPDGMPLLRLDQVAAARYGDPALWPLVAEANGVDDPLALPADIVLRLPEGTQPLATG